MAFAVTGANVNGAFVGGRDLHRGLALFQERHGEVAWIDDIKHKTASLSRRELAGDAVWTAFAQRAKPMQRQVYQTELLASSPRSATSHATRRIIFSVEAATEPARPRREQPTRSSLGRPALVR